MGVVFLKASLSPFGKVMAKLREENNETDLSHQYKMLNVSSRALTIVLYGYKEPPAEWEDIICREYHITHEEFEQRMVAAESGADISLKDFENTSMGRLVLSIVKKYNITIDDIAGATGFAVGYIDKQCRGILKASPVFQSVLTSTYPLSNEEIVSSSPKEASSLKEATLENCTLKQRSLMWFFFRSLSLISPESCDEMLSIVRSCAKHPEVSSDVIPFSLWMQDYFSMPGAKKIMQLAKDSKLSYKTVSSYKNGLAIPSEYDAYLIAQGAGLPDYAIQGARFYAELSQNKIESKCDSRLVTTQQIELYKELISTIHRIPDDVAERLLEILWDTRHRGAPRRPQQKYLSSSSGALSKTPFNIYLRGIPEKPETTPVIATRSGVTLATLSRMLTGEVDISYSVFVSLCENYGCTPFQVEMLRFYADLSRRIIPLDNFGGTPQQRIMAMAFQRFYLSFSDEDSRKLEELFFELADKNIIFSLDQDLQGK